MLSSRIIFVLSSKDCNNFRILTRLHESRSKVIFFINSGVISGGSQKYVYTDGGVTNTMDAIPSTPILLFRYLLIVGWHMINVINWGDTNIHYQY
jgi:hypothetical protein